MCGQCIHAVLHDGYVHTEAKKVGGWVGLHGIGLNVRIRACIVLPLDGMQNMLVYL